MREFLQREPVKVRLIAFAAFLAALLMLFLPWETVADADVRRQIADAADEVASYDEEDFLFGLGGEEVTDLVKQAKKLVGVLKDGALTPLETGTAARVVSKLAKGIREGGVQ